MKRLLLVIAVLCLPSASHSQSPSVASAGGLAVLSPANGATLDTCLTATLRWQYPAQGADYAPAAKTLLQVSLREDLNSPIVSVELAENVTTYRLAVVPQTTYHWEIAPFDEKGLRRDRSARGRFTSGAPGLDATAEDRVRYRNPREGAHWLALKPVEFSQPEPLSPWHGRKSYLDQRIPRFEDLKGRLPIPVFDGHPETLDAYWYCWRTLLGIWSFAPDSPDHQAVANICGIKSWGPWGSTMVFDTAFILHFARYGHAAWPFVTALDNCYARQHENGFICRETDKNNREVYVIFPVNPPLFAWAEWEWYRVSGDRERLRRVLLPIVKHYEWFMTYQRRADGVYWTNGAQEADDSPRNTLMHRAVSATSYQALAARHLAMMARVVGREDLAKFFTAEHRQLGELVNRRFWDEAHGLYNDLAADDRFITELSPGSFCKHVHMFWPMLAGIVPADRVSRLVTELQNPASFNRRNGVPSLSADSAGYTGGPAGNGQYWRGAVWPSGQCMVQEGLRACGQDALARHLAEKYFFAQLEVFGKEKTIKENLAPDQALGCGVSEFVGWGGLGPVANLIEAVLGFDLNAPEGTITWNLVRTERHGLQGLRLGNVEVDLVAERRAGPDDPCEIQVRSGGAFTLKCVLHGKTTEIHVPTGTSRHLVGP
jgi:hypothetical protein